MIRTPHEEILAELKGAELVDGLRWRRRVRRMPAALPFVIFGAAFIALLAILAAARG